MKCFQCGKEIPADSNFCIYCGSSISRTEPPPLPAENPNLSPAESLILLDQNTDFSQLVKLTVMDLVVRKILCIKEKEKTTGLLKRKKTEPYLSRGENFAKYQLKPHEQIIVDCIKPDEFEIDLHNFSLRLRSQRTKYSKEYLKTPLTEKGYFTVEEKKALRIFKYRKWTLTPKGENTRTQIEQFIEQAKNNLPHMVQNEPNKAAAFLALAGGNLLLLSMHGFSLNDFKNWFDSVPVDKIERGFYDYYDFPWHSGMGPLDSDLDSSFDFDSLDFDFDDLASLDSSFDFDDYFDGGDFDGGDGGDFGGD
ncbi:MAG: hypothetical protein DRG59_06090 [Deltaproteobacteria bacterium]|nr:MAG: hypothetical protein DRG83_18055 [Deltaproteobacteria bacterium]RLB07707.1 MAG: hypothetical protein DRG59_06090 [Deltaproteobacteria bacterium]HEC31946.1 zinc-ribbon domain-containing protein [Deltaproteobacteria bacterium]